jgi:hypothetical protein
VALAAGRTQDEVAREAEPEAEAEAAPGWLFDD